jgi:calcineurin-like phosphoesterase family protein
MDEEMVRRHNERVKPNDKCYFLGDVAIARKSLRILERLNGDKVLIKGNHDIFKLADYAPYFREVRAYHVMNGMILSHVPVHESSLARFGCNIHGHLHYQRVMRARGVDVRTGEIQYSDQIDPRYWCACVEHTDYAPILFEDAVEMIQAQGGHVGFRGGNTSQID